MSARNVSHLGHVFIGSVLSAAAGFYGHAKISPWVQSLLGKYAGGHTLEPAVATGVSYATLFLTCLVLFLFLSHHLFIRVSLKAHGLEKATGAAPVFARFVLVTAIFGGALFLLLEKSASIPSLNALVTAAQNKTTAAPETGYKPADRQKLDKLIHEGAKHD